MTDKKELTYHEAGVDVKEGARAVELMKAHVKSTYNKDVIGDLGNFGGLFRLSGQYENPVLVSGTDGVGTKLKVAFMADQHDTVGIDLVAMCVNDILCQGAKPLFFLDYLATGKLKAEKAEALVRGVAQGCRMSQMALLGGETAEMPGFYTEDEYDMAGFAVGVVDEDKIITGKTIKEEDVLIGLASSGLHSNGYSLVRKALFDHCGLDLQDQPKGLEKPLGEVLLEPTKIYVDPVLKVLETFEVKGMVHMTGGGFYENIPRILQEGLKAEIQLGSWPVTGIFKYLQEAGHISVKEMLGTFNMGIGFILVVDPTKALEIQAFLKSIGEESYTIGRIAKGQTQTQITFEGAWA